MPTFVALLRGVNVGKAKRVPMAEFRRLLEGLGYTGVATLLNSGNAVFRCSKRASAAARIAADIAAAIKDQLEVDVPVIVMSTTTLAAIVSQNTVHAEAADHPRLLVALVQDAKALAGLSSVEALVVPPERFAVGKHAAYLLCANGILESKAGDALLGKAGRSVTSRNWATVLKLQAMARAGEA
ncbi:MAG: DUF1697 domain-containing protein [Burkholderiaceae bacterium]